MSAPRSIPALRLRTNKTSRRTNTIPAGWKRRTLPVVKRESSTVDRREVHVRLTDAGVKRLAQLADLHRSELRTLQRDLSLRDLFSDAEDR